VEEGGEGGGGEGGRDGRGWRRDRVGGRCARDQRVRGISACAGSCAQQKVEEVEERAVMICCGVVEEEMMEMEVEMEVRRSGGRR
jgi:hypothetical protein